VTQPAFSRRIQSLENWLGTDLVDRTSYPDPADAGRRSCSTNRRWKCWRRSTACATCCAIQARTPTQTIDLAVPHTLSLTFVPKWLTALEQDFAPINSRLMALNVHDAVLQLVEGGCDLLLCYHHPRQPVQLDPGRYDMLVLGRESLRAYARCGAKTKSRNSRLPGTQGTAAALPLLHQQRLPGAHGGADTDRRENPAAPGPATKPTWRKA
jgi:DNA-binding transcriptional LysR family regulator